MEWVGISVMVVIFFGSLAMMMITLIAAHNRIDDLVDRVRRLEERFLTRPGAAEIRTLKRKDRKNV